MQGFIPQMNKLPNDELLNDSIIETKWPLVNNYFLTVIYNIEIYGF